MRVYMYTVICVCVSVQMCVCASIYICVRICINVYVCVSVYIGESDQNTWASRLDTLCGRATSTSWDGTSVYSEIASSRKGSSDGFAPSESFLGSSTIERACSEAFRTTDAAAAACQPLLLRPRQRRRPGQEGSELQATSLASNTRYEGATTKTQQSGDTDTARRASSAWD